MVSREELKVQRHQLYNSIADVCEQGLRQQGMMDMSYAGAGALLDQLQAVLEAESSRNSVDGVEDTETKGDIQESKHQCLVKRQKAHNAASAVQVLKTELAHKIESMTCQQYKRQTINNTEDQIQQLALTANDDWRHGYLQKHLAASPVASQRQQLQIEHELKTWRLAAQHATALAEAANKRAAEAELQLAECSTLTDLLKQQLVERRQETVLLRKRLKQVQKQMHTRMELEHQLRSTVLQPLSDWFQACAHSPELKPNSSSSSSSSSDVLSHETGVNCEHTSKLSSKLVQAAAAATEQLLAHVGTWQNADVSVQEQQAEQCHEHLQQLQNALEQAQTDLQVAHNTIITLQEQVDAAKQQQNTLEDQLKLQKLAAANELKDLHQLAANSRDAAEKAGQDLQHKEQQLATLQQQLQQVQADLAASEQRAAAAEQLVRQLQQHVQQEVHSAQKHSQERDQLHRERLIQLQADHMTSQQHTLAKLTADKEAALQLAEQQAALTLETALKEQKLAAMEAQAAWDQEKAALEKQQIEALLASRLTAQHTLEQERRQWQQERDEAVQRMAAQHTSAEMQAQQQQKALQEQLELLQQEVQYLRGLSAGVRPGQQAPGSAANDHSNALLAADSLNTICYAVKLSKAITAAEAERRRALQEATAAQHQVQQLTLQMEQQEQELLHMRRALDELHNACQAAADARREAEASSAASAAVLQEQHSKVRQLQVEMDIQRQEHQQELSALQQSMRDQVALIQSDARAELEAAQTRMQLLRIKQQRFVNRLKLGDQKTTLRP